METELYLQPVFYLLLLLGCGGESRGLEVIPKQVLNHLTIRRYQCEFSSAVSAIAHSEQRHTDLALLDHLPKLQK